MKRTFVTFLPLAFSIAAACQAQVPNSSQPCDMIITIKDAKTCVDRPLRHDVQTLASDHVYTLPELIDLAESNSPEGRVAWAQAKSSLEQAGIARAAYLPVIALIAGGSDLRTIVPFPKPIAPRGYVTVEEPTAMAQLALEYSLLDYGRGARLDAAKASQIASAQRLTRVHQQIAYNISTLFYREQLEAGHLVADQVILHDAETLRDNAQSQFDHGRATLPDLQNAQAGVAEAQFALASAEGSVKKAKLALTEAAGVEPTTEIELPEQPATITPETLAPQVEDLIQSAWKTRPDLLAKAEDLKHAQDIMKSAHSAYLPSAHLSATGGQTAMWPTADYGSLGRANVSTWSASLSLKWDVFNAARRHEVQNAIDEQHAAIEEKRAAQDRVTREVWQAYVDYQTAAQQQKSAQAFLAASQISYDSSLDAFGYGVRSLVDVVQAERQLSQARIAAVDANAQLSLSASTLVYATGASR